MTYDHEVLTVAYTDATPASQLMYGQIVCSGLAQPGVREIRVYRNGVRLDGLRSYDQFKGYISR